MGLAAPTGCLSSRAASEAASARSRAASAHVHCQRLQCPMQSQKHNTYNKTKHKQQRSSNNNDIPSVAILAQGSGAAGLPRPARTANVSISSGCGPRPPRGIRDEFIAGVAHRPRVGPPRGELRASENPRGRAAVPHKREPRRSRPHQYGRPPAVDQRHQAGGAAARHEERRALTQQGARELPFTVQPCWRAARHEESCAPTQVAQPQGARPQVARPQGARQVGGTGICARSIAVQWAAREALGQALPGPQPPCLQK